MINLKNFDSIEFLNNGSLKKKLASIDSFYINSALCSVYDKKGSEFINIRNSVKRFYEDVYYYRVKTPENIDDSWVSATISRYVDQDIKYFKDNVKPSGESEHQIIIKKVLDDIAESKVKINYEGLKIDLKLGEIDGGIFDVEIISTLRGKLSSRIMLKGKEIDFSGIVAPARNLQKHEVLTLQWFVRLNLKDTEIMFIVSKIGNNFSKVFICDDKVSSEHSFEELNIDWGSFDINRGV